MAVIDVPISTLRLCDVCGASAPEFFTCVDHNELPVTACPACMQRVRLAPGRAIVRAGEDRPPVRH